MSQVSSSKVSVLAPAYSELSFLPGGAGGGGGIAPALFFGTGGAGVLAVVLAVVVAVAVAEGSF